MRNYTQIMKDCMKELDSIHLATYSRRIISITINNRLSRSLGRCRRKYGDFYIELAGKVARDDVDLHFIKNIIMHELVHTMPGCFNHGPEFHRIGDMVSRKLGYHIDTHETVENMEAAGVKPIIKSEEAKYALVCKKCGAKIYKMRWCNALANPGNYRHTACGGDLYTVSLDPNVAIPSVTWNK